MWEKLFEGPVDIEQQYENSNWAKNIGNGYILYVVLELDTVVGRGTIRMRRRIATSKRKK